MNALVKYDEACRILATATSIDVVRDIRNEAEVLRAYARQAKNRTLEINAAEIRLRAERRLGELIAAQRQTLGLSKGGAGRHKKLTGLNENPVTETATLAEAGIDKNLAERARRYAAIPLDEFDDIVLEWRAAIARETDRVTVNLLRQGERRIHRPPSSSPAPIAGQYRVIYADPPWQYNNAGVIDDADSYGRAARHYDTLSIAELCAMAIADHTCPDAVLFMWVTSPLLFEAMPVIDAWGFSYKTSIVWDKVAHNFGHYVSVRHEFLLIATRGSCTPDRPTPMPDSVMTIPRSKVHSEKPAEFRALIERLYDGPRLELFARAACTGWTTWGNQVNDCVAV